MAASHLPSVLKWLRHEGLVRGLSNRVTSAILRGIGGNMGIRENLKAAIDEAFNLCHSDFVEVYMDILPDDACRCCGAGYAERIMADPRVESLLSLAESDRPSPIDTIRQMFASGRILYYSDIALETGLGLEDVVAMCDKLESNGEISKSRVLGPMSPEIEVEKEVIFDTPPCPSSRVRFHAQRVHRVVEASPDVF